MNMATTYIVVTSEITSFWDPHTHSLALLESYKLLYVSLLIRPSRSFLKNTEHTLRDLLKIHKIQRTKL